MCGNITALSCATSVLFLIGELLPFCARHKPLTGAEDGRRYRESLSVMRLRMAFTES